MPKYETLPVPEFPPRPEFTIVKSTEKTSVLDGEGKEQMSFPRPPIAIPKIFGELNFNLGTAASLMWRHAKSGADDTENLREAIRFIQLEIERVGK